MLLILLKKIKEKKNMETSGKSTSLLNFILVLKFNVSHKVVENLFCS